jgi:hypothetical protein
MGSFLDTEISGVLINSVASEKMLKEIEDAGLLEPNKIYITPDEDTPIGTLLYNGTITSSSTNIDLSGFDLGKGTYDIQIMGTCPNGTDTYFRVNNDASGYDEIRINNYNNTAPVGQYVYNQANFTAGGMWAYRTFYNITLTVDDENVLTYALTGCGVYQSSTNKTVYNRIFNGIKMGLSDGKLKSIQYGSSSGYTIYAYIKIYKRY